MKHLGWPPQFRARSLSRSGVFVALTAVSLVAHGVVLGLPWPETEPAPEPSSTEASATAVLDVAILPSSSPAPPDVDVKEPSRTVQPAEQPRSVAARSTAAAGRRSPPPPAATPPESPPVTPPSTPPEPTLPPLPAAEPEADPIADLPIAAGTETAPPAPPSLEEQLQDAAAYQYDGRKSLKQAEAYQVSANWVAAGQILPENVAPIELPYQLGATCLDTPPESGLLAVVLDAAGNFVQGPEVIDSTGYPLLDEQALAIAAAGEHPFPDRSEPRGYVAEILVQYPPNCL